MFTFKNEKSTPKEYNHINVYNDGVYIGYITSPKVNIVIGLWYFSSLSPFSIFNMAEYNQIISKIK